MNFTKTIACVVVAAASFAAKADYLYWQIDNATFTMPSIADANFEFATVRGAAKGDAATDKVGDSSDYYKLYTVNGGQSAATDEYRFFSDPTDPNSTEGGAQFFGDFNSDVGLFLFELWNSDGELVGFSEMTRSEILYAISPTGGFAGESIAYRPFSLQGVVPEPSSGILMLVGIAGLSLRRKRAA